MRGVTMLEAVVATALSGGLILFVLGIVRYAGSLLHHEVSFGYQMRRAESLIDDMLVGLRWISYRDQTLAVTDPLAGNQTASVTFRRMKEVQADGTIIWGDRLTYYWLPSARENAKYINGDRALYDEHDLDSLDQDLNGVADDGVIWRQIDDADGDGKLDNLGIENLSGVGTIHRTIVLEHVPPPFYWSGGTKIGLDSFSVLPDIVQRNLQITVKYFGNTGQATRPDGSGLPDGVATSAPVVKDPQVAVYATRRMYCMRN